MVFDKVKEAVAEQMGTEEAEITMEASFKDDLGADSLDLFELVMQLEETFELEIPSEDLENLLTVGDVVNYLQEKGAE